MYDILLQASTELRQFSFLTRATLNQLAYRFVDLNKNILYALLHEPIYCQNAVARWSAQCVGERLEEFAWLRRDFEMEGNGDGQCLIFASEMIFPFMFEVYEELEKIGVVAEILTSFQWPRLYDLEVLARNEVPVFAVRLA